jgi:hypothetical protein
LSASIMSLIFAGSWLMMRVATRSVSTLFVPHDDEAGVDGVNRARGRHPPRPRSRRLW